MRTHRRSVSSNNRFCCDTLNLSCPARRPALATLRIDCLRSSSNFNYVGDTPDNLKRFLTIKAKRVARPRPAEYEASGRLHTHLGEWHTHPGGALRLSGKDRNTLARVANHKEARLSTPVMLVGTGRFELPTPRTPSECSTRLSHVPTLIRTKKVRMGLTKKFYTSRGRSSFRVRKPRLLPRLKTLALILSSQAAWPRCFFLPRPLPSLAVSSLVLSRLSGWRCAPASESGPKCLS